MNRLRLLIAALGLSGAMLVSANLIAPEEGLVNQTYPDIGGVKTYCIGETRGATLGAYYDDATCGRIFKGRLQETHAAVRAEINRPMSPYTEAAFASFIYNLGRSAFHKSTMRKLYNEGHKEQACAQFLRWVYVAGKDCRLPASKCGGIIKRRKLEMGTCLR